MKKSTIALCLMVLVSVGVLAGCKKQTPTQDDINMPTDNSQNVENSNDDDMVDDSADPDMDDEVAAGADADIVSLANCLSDNGVTMYGTEWCGHCKNQKALFGDAFNQVDYVDCDAQRQVCLNAGVRGFPTWIDAEGNPFPGTQSLERLAEIGECEYAG